MTFDIINNLDTCTHNTMIKSYLGNCDEFILISPFLSRSFNSFPFNRFGNQLKKIVLVTTLKQNISEQLNKISFFEELFSFGHKNNIKIEILLDNSLHAKIYIFKKNSDYNSGIITSANFTKSGLSKNNEWGVAIHDANILNKIEYRIFSNIVYEKITLADVNTFKKKIGNVTLQKSEKENHIDLLSDINIKENPLNLDTKTTFWLKPIGTIEDPIPWAKQFNKLEENLYFSNKYPSGIAIGDILITYAVIHKNILSVFRVKSNVIVNKNNKRFPYYVVGDNMTPFYGGNWFNYNITISNQRDEILSKKLFNITPSGKNSYGSFMYGADKLKITNKFASYLVNKIIKEDKKIEASIAE